MKITMKDGHAGSLEFQPGLDKGRQVLIRGTKKSKEYSLQGFVDNWSKGVIRALPGNPPERIDIDDED